MEIGEHPASNLKIHSTKPPLKSEIKAATTTQNKLRS